MGTARNKRANRATRLGAWLAVAGCFSCASASTPASRAAGPNLTRGLATADSLITAAIGTLTAGAVLTVAKNGVVVHERAFGHAELNDYELRRLSAPRVLRTSTLFDLASVTKVMGTTMAIMMLVDRGLVDLDAPVHRYLADFRGPRLDSITVRHLLNHSSGLAQWQPLYYSASNSVQAYSAIRNMPLGWGVGEARHYSDLGFMLLGYIVERVSGHRLDAFLAHTLYEPLGLRTIGFLPGTRGFTDIAATEQGNVYERRMVYDSTFAFMYRGDPTAWTGWRGYVLVGEADDGNAWYAHGGVAGHAGLFSAAGDLRVLLDLLINRGTHNGRRIIGAETIDHFLTLDKYQNYLGWRLPRAMPPGSFDHTGFTGTYVLGVPAHKLSIVLLTNRQNVGPNARGFFPDLAGLQSAVARSIVEGARSDAVESR